MHNNYIIKSHKCRVKKDKAVNKKTLASSRKEGISSSPNIKLTYKNEKHHSDFHHTKTRSKTKVNETNYNYKSNN